MARKKNDVQVEEIVEIAPVEEEVAEVVEVITETEEKIKDIKSDESPRFTLAQLMASNRYRKHAHLLDAYLKKDKTYTLKEVDELISGLI